MTHPRCPTPGARSAFRRAVAATAGVALAVLVVACRGPAPGNDAPTAPSVRVPIGADPLTVALLNTSDQYSNVIGLLVSDALVRYDERLDLVGRVAESWEVSEDRRTITFRLREGVRWHDGRPVTAADVVFSFEKIRDPANGDRSAPGQFAAVTVEAPDPRTVVARYAEAEADLLDAWTFPLIPGHLAAGDADLLQGSFAQAPVGCGPFRLVRYERGNEIVLEAVADHWAGKPGIDRLVLKVMRDQRTALQALLAGDLELMALPPALYREALDSGRADRFRSIVYPRLSVWYLAYNVRREALADPRVRRALVHLLDRETFIREVLDGLAAPGVTTWHPDTVWADPTLRPIPFDPEKARALLAEAGFRDTDGDGVVDRDGEPFEISLLYSPGSQSLFDSFAAWYQQSLADGGVRVRLDSLEFQAMRDRRDAADFDVVMGSFGLDTTGDQSELYRSTSIEDGFNFFGWNDPETDRLLELGRTSLDTEARRGAYHALQRRLLERSPIVALFYLETPLLVRRDLEGVRPTALGLYRTVPGPAGWAWAEDGTD